MTEAPQVQGPGLTPAKGAASVLMPQAAGPALWVESVAMTLIALAICRWSSPQDPLYIQSQFPWPWLAPVLVALRYGVMPGIVSSSILLADFYFWAPAGLDAELPQLYFLGGLLTVMLCGEYSGIWRTRLRRQSEINAYLEDRVERVTKRLYLLRLSHDRLEQDLLARPATLRDALTELRRRMIGKSGKEALPGAQQFLEFLAQHCQLEVAALYAADWNIERSYVRVAAVGEPPPLSPGDPLLAFARERRQLAHVQTDELDKGQPTGHLVAAPIMANDRHVLGMLVVTRMPFFAIKEESLQMIAVLLSVYADAITSATQVLPLLASNPGCPPTFAEELVKLARLQRDFGIQSQIVVLVFGNSGTRLDVYHHALRQRRSPDEVWQVESLAGRSFIINLMPLATPTAVEGYLARTEISLQQNFGGDFDALHIRHYTISLADPDPLTSVRRLLAERR